MSGIRQSLVVLAAGLGSRYGAPKQVETVGAMGETILDYALFDALRSGFDRIVFVVRRDFEAAFRAAVGAKYEKLCEVVYVHQEIDDLPAGFVPPSGRVKPWGTGHAVWCARAALYGPFSVINADDFYGRASFKELSEFSRSGVAMASCQPIFAMIGFRLANTLSEVGAVSRGICNIGPDDRLRSLVERTDIRREDVGDGRTYTGNEVVSMNCWAFTPELIPALERQLAAFLSMATTSDKTEFYLPSAISTLIADREISVRVLRSTANWFGVTYREDKPRVTAAIRELVARGEYPASLLPEGTGALS
jgi:NDP-sugar pyrophosphorylase family protein